MTIVFFARSAWKTFVMTKRLPFAVEGPLVAVMTPSALTVVVYGRLSTTAGGTKVPGTTQSDAGLVHKVEPQYCGWAVVSVSNSSPSSLKLVTRAPMAGLTVNESGPI